jgi:hypothetical protein
MAKPTSVWVADLRSVKEYIFPVHEPRVLLPASPISFMGSTLRIRSGSRRFERVVIVGERKVFSQKMNDYMIRSRRASALQNFSQWASTRLRGPPRTNLATSTEYGVQYSSCNPK